MTASLDIATPGSLWGMTRRSVQGQVTVSASPADVYHLWNQRYLYPQFMERVIHVEELDETWSRWVVVGEYGPEPLEVETTDNVPRRLVAWRDVGPGTPHTIVRIAGSSAGPTTVQVQVSWDEPEDLTTEQRDTDAEQRRQQLDADLLSLRRCLEAEDHELIDLTAARQQQPGRALSAQEARRESGPR